MLNEDKIEPIVINLSDIGSEKRYIDVARKYGLDDPRTASNKAKLAKSIASFERETGIKWPFK